jgi:hypothetical protein
MPVTYTDAQDELFGIVNGAVAQLGSIVGYIPSIQWPGSAVAGSPDYSKIWMRVSSKIVTDKLSALGNRAGQRLYKANGLMFIQLFAPRTLASTFLAKQAAQFIRDFFRTESVTGELRFVEAKMVELDPEDLYYPINIAVQFEYYTLSGQTSNQGIIPPIIAAGFKHFPVEAIDGIRTVFTFANLPADSNFYLVIWNGVIQDGLAQTGNQIDFGTAPKPAGPGFPADVIYAIYVGV